MAAAVVGGAFLSAFIEVVLDRLTSPKFVNWIRGKKVDVNLVQRLKNTLYAVEAVLNDAEQKHIKDSGVKNWLNDLKDAVYEADDLLDHISTKAAAATPNQLQVSTTTNFVSSYFNFHDSEKEMVHKLEDLVARLESILKLKDILHLKEIARDISSWRTPSSSLEEQGSKIYGRDEDRKAILKLLLDDDDVGDASSKIHVIPIVGMGGVGKTTLAQSVYNDVNIKQKFDLQAWACVSDQFDVLKVTKAITKSVTRSGSCDTKDIDLLHLDLKEKLIGKKFLIVLDDVWTEYYEGWNFLLRPFQYEAKGSRILVTTRSDKVAFMVQTFQGYHLKQLSNEDCWSVFEHHACLSLGPIENITTMSLQKIGREIVRKYNGLPLAAQSLGGLLRGKRDVSNWNNVLKSNFWEISEDESKIIPSLKISYHYLPSHLKRCFVYCSIYPKDHIFDKDDLILLWMAEDLLQPSKNGKTLEEVGYEYFNDLASRSFFQRLESDSDYKSKSFVMHDLMHDLATFFGGEFYFRTKELGKEMEISMKTRHLSFSNSIGPISEDFKFFSRVKFLRTFLPIDWPSYFGNEKAQYIVVSNLKYLRVLSLCLFQGLNALPDSIDELIHLHYLSLSRTSIKTLPESLCNLYNLQTLKLSKCYYLKKLPNDMHNLVNLRHLDISYTKLEEMPKEMSKLVHLQHLSYFIIGKDEEKDMKELGTLSNLHGSFSIKKLENVTNSFKASEARIMDKKNLKKISLQWSVKAKDNFINSQSEMDILCKLRPVKSLEMLDIYGYRGTRFAKWVGDSSYNNITSVCMYACLNCCILPSFGQLPSLKKLVIGDMNMVEIIGSEFFKSDESFSGTAFPTLEHLEFKFMSSWKVWHHPSSHEDLGGGVVFPVLKSLVLYDCPKLLGDLPTRLPALEKIQIMYCDQLTSSLPSAFAIQKLEISKSNKMVSQELPVSVEELNIDERHVSDFMFNSITSILPISLKILKFEHCSSVMSFPGDCLPLSLESLTIEDCRNLNFPKQNQLQHESLQFLNISNSCDPLTTFPLETFPNLCQLYITNCRNLEYLSMSKVLQNLNEIVISHCPKFVSFSREGLSAPNLTSFTVTNCVKLKSLPCHLKTLLLKLEELNISHCPKIETFPEGGMPPSLRKLHITGCEKLLRCPSLALMDKLTSLIITNPGISVEWFPKEGLVLLPPSLTSMELYQFSSLHTLECMGFLHLTSLQQLIIVDCPKLENMTGERLPASLIKLLIYGSPMLEGRCYMKHQQIWPKISHIQDIRLTGKRIS